MVERLGVLLGFAVDDELEEDDEDDNGDGDEDLAALVAAGADCRRRGVTAAILGWVL